MSTERVTDVPPPPWTCRLRAVARVVRIGSWVGALAVVRYDDTPVGPYAEAFTARAGLVHATVPWMVVDSEASVVGGREYWGLPKQLGRIDFSEDLREAHVEAEPTRMTVRALRTGPPVPVVLPGLLRQPGRGRAAVRFTGFLRPALVSVEGDAPVPASGPGLGAALSGTLTIGPPH